MEYEAYIFWVVVVSNSLLSHLQPLKKSRSKKRQRNYSIKYCGTQGQICQPGSRKVIVL